MADAPPDGPAAGPRVCYHCVVSGRVQGVWFRGATREQAVRLGVTGYARNLADGRVEVLACGTADAVAQLREWLRTGPSMAQVSEVVCQPRAYQPWSGFSVE
jgi:acylphosphatase